jgi:GTP cyclohydrolase II
MTNNPEKVAAFELAGVTVVERVPLALAEGSHNRAYLATKRDRAGHLLP